MTVVRSTILLIVAALMLVSVLCVTASSHSHGCHACMSAPVNAYLEPNQSPYASSYAPELDSLHPSFVPDTSWQPAFPQIHFDQHKPQLNYRDFTSENEDSSQSSADAFDQPQLQLRETVAPRLNTSKFHKHIKPIDDALYDFGQTEYIAFALQHVPTV